MHAGMYECMYAFVYAGRQDSYADHLMKNGDSFIFPEKGSQSKAIPVCNVIYVCTLIFMYAFLYVCMYVCMYV